MALSPTANQGARPNPAYANAAHAVESQRGSPQSGGDRGGPKGFLKGKGIPTSGGTAKPGASYATDRTHDQGGKRLYLGKAYENAQRPKPVRVKGNSEGRASIPSGTESSTVKKAATVRLNKQNTANHALMLGHDEFSAQPFRKSSGAFGPLIPRRQTSARDHNEHQSTRRFA